MKRILFVSISFFGIHTSYAMHITKVLKDATKHIYIEDFIEVIKTGNVALVQEHLKNQPRLAKFSDDVGLTGLIVAARFGHYDICKLLIEHGAPVNAQEDYTFTFALAHAVFEKYIPIVKLLLDNKADPNLTFVCGTPIETAIANGDCPMAELLIAYGARTWPDEGWLLYDAAKFRHGAMIALLKRHGHDVNVDSGTKYSPLMKAVKDRNVDAARLLLEHGADVNITDEFGYTVLDHAIEQRDEHMVELLKQHSGVVSGYFYPLGER